MSKLLFLAGSARKESLNKKLAVAAAKMADEAGAQATFIDLRDYEMPIYDGDWEEREGVPETTLALVKLFAEHDGFFIASPEYNSSYSSLLKNTLDWMSRPQNTETPLVPFKGKIAALGAVSPGGLGGLRGLPPLRVMLSNIGVHVIPTQVAVGNGFQAFDDSNNMADETQAGMLKGVIDEFVATADKLKA